MVRRLATCSPQQGLLVKIAMNRKDSMATTKEVPLATSALHPSIKLPSKVRVLDQHHSTKHLLRAHMFDPRLSSSSSSSSNLLTARGR